LIDEYFPEYSFHVHSDYKTSIKKKIIERATGIIAISESTKKDIVERFNTDPNKIKVIYHGVSEFETDEENTRIVPEQYFLFVGKRTHYKNFYFFIQCIESFLIKDPTLKVVCVGAKFNNLEIQYFKDLKVLENIKYINADDSMLGNLYRYAVAFVYPSLYEGFGMPILEAFKNSCPVLLSNTSSLPEIAGEAALYFNPKDINSVKASIYKILNDESFRDNLIKKGIERVKKFSWNTTVEQTLQFYRALT
jgi:glycosyltransferase involved in cell wall biosynthesis